MPVYEVQHRNLCNWLITSNCLDSNSTEGKNKPEQWTAYMKTFIIIIALTTIVSLTSIAARPRVVLLNADGQLSIEETISNADDTAEQTADKGKEEAKKKQTEESQR